MLYRSKFPEFVIISFIVHCLLVVLVSLPKSKPDPKPEQITVEIQSPPPPPVARKIPIPKIPDSQQIVEQEEKKPTEEVPDTKLISSQNQKVLKQTVSKNLGAFKNSKKSATRKTASKSPNNNLKIATSTDAEALIKAEGGEKGSQDDKSESASSQNNDFIKDIDEGMETLLNTREFKFYAYYNRIRLQLSEHWESNVKEKVSQMLRDGRNLAAEDRITKLVVILDRSGHLMKVQVVKESGITDLDDAVTDAFQSASPFPVPPVGILEPDGTVIIRWDFVLEG